MAKRKTARDLSKAIGRDGIRSAALPPGYAILLADLKARVRSAQLRAAVSVNGELIVLYWDIGKAIVEAQKTKGYGKLVVERLAADLQNAFPGIKGFSPQNVWFMRSFFLAWSAVAPILSQPVRESERAKLSQPVRELTASAPPSPLSKLPWGHISAIKH